VSGIILESYEETVPVDFSLLVMRVYVCLSASISQQPLVRTSVAWSSSGSVTLPLFWAFTPFPDVKYRPTRVKEIRPPTN